MTEITSGISTALADRYGIQHELGTGSIATAYLARAAPLAEFRIPHIFDAIYRRAAMAEVLASNHRPIPARGNGYDWWSNSRRL